ncbi:hypothetical protein [Mesorhizobium sp. 131-2-1]|jgi:hypothetical protein|uniref:hypothetical protein n=1 Tax=Mesorhizobium sp. 131-2-1 TaxID=2744518 RepID=UPI001928538B|nr:hypothetical protein [Mesorhizobium sp. 131-2-1]BCG96878.1 hypothetical protein MesoLj131a_57420 [Mesorhizobium sp. 131-2-1]
MPMTSAHIENQIGLASAWGRPTNISAEDIAAIGYVLIYAMDVLNPVRETRFTLNSVINVINSLSRSTAGDNLEQAIVIALRRYQRADDA